MRGLLACLILCPAIALAEGRGAPDLAASPCPPLPEPLAPAVLNGPPAQWWVVTFDRKIDRADRLILNLLGFRLVELAGKSGPDHSYIELMTAQRLQELQVLLAEKLHLGLTPSAYEDDASRVRDRLLAGGSKPDGRLTIRVVQFPSMPTPVPPATWFEDILKAGSDQDMAELQAVVRQVARERSCGAPSGLPAEQRLTGFRSGGEAPQAMLALEMLEGAAGGLQPFVDGLEPRLAMDTPFLPRGGKDTSSANMRLLEFSSLAEAMTEIRSQGPRLRVAEVVGAVVEDSAGRSEAERILAALEAHRPSSRFDGTGQIVNVVEAWPFDPRDRWLRPRRVGGIGSGAPSRHATVVAGAVVAGYYSASYEGRQAADSVGPQLFSTSLGDPANLGRALGCVAERPPHPRVHVTAWHATTPYDAVAWNVDEFTWRHEGDVIVASAGNAAPMGPPGIAKNVVSVGWIASEPEGGERRLGGGAGETPDHRFKPDIHAPGCDVVSSIGNDERRMVEGCSTSLAAALVARDAAGLRAAYANETIPSLWADGVPTHDPSGALIKATLLTATGVMRGQGSRVEGLDLDAALGDRYLSVADVRHERGLDTEEQCEYAFSPAEAEEVRFTLAWTDAPPALGFYERPSVNELRLEVTGPDGKPCDVQQDSVNNVAQCVVAWPRGVEAPSWKVRVFAEDVAVVPGPLQGQGYALVMAAGGSRVSFTAERPKSAVSSRDGAATMGARPSTDRSLPARQRLDLDFAVGATHGDEEIGAAAGESDDTHWIADGLVDYRFTQVESDGEDLPRERRAWEVGVGASGLRESHEGRSAADRDGYGVWLYHDRPVRPGSRHSWGVLASHADVDGGDGFASQATGLESAISLVWGGEDGEPSRCEPRRMVFYAGTSLFERERSVGPDDDGQDVVVGAQFSLLESPDPQDLRCEERGVFRRLYLDDAFNLHAGYEHRWESVDGEDGDRDIDRFWVEGQVPLNLSDDTFDPAATWRRITLDWSAAYDAMRSGGAGSLDDASAAAIGIGFTFPVAPLGDGDAAGTHDLAIRLGATHSWMDAGGLGDDEWTVLSLVFRAKFGGVGRGIPGTRDDLPATGSTLNPDVGLGPGSGTLPIVVVTRP